MASSPECVDEEEEVSLLFLGQEDKEIGAEENEKSSQGSYTANKTVTLAGKQEDYVLGRIVPDFLNINLTDTTSRIVNYQLEKYQSRSDKIRRFIYQNNRLTFIIEDNC